MAKMDEGRILETATEARQAERGPTVSYWPSPSCTSSISRAEAEPARDSAGRDAAQKPPALRG
jgi:hypothetical protein